MLCVKGIYQQPYCTADNASHAFRITLICGNRSSSNLLQLPAVTNSKSAVYFTWIWLAPKIRAKIRQIRIIGPDCLWTSRS